MPTVTPAELVAERLLGVLMAEPSGLFSDFDGTLSHVAPTPSGASVVPGARPALRKLASQLDLVGIVTGRAIDDVQGKVNLPELLYVGNHGLEWAAHRAHIDHPAGIAAADSVASALRFIKVELEATTSTAGVIFEDKRLSGSIHYRLSEDPVRMGHVLGSIIGRTAKLHGLHVSSGKMVFELRPSAMVSKGTALTKIVIDHELKGAVFLGDDVTDVDGFLALKQLRATHGVSTCAVGVLTSDTAPSVIAESDVLLDGVDDVVRTLEALSRRLPHKSRNEPAEG